MELLKYKFLKINVLLLKIQKIICKICDLLHINYQKYNKVLNVPILLEKYLKYIK